MAVLRFFKRRIDEKETGNEQAEFDGFKQVLDLAADVLRRSSNHEKATRMPTFTDILEYAESILPNFVPPRV